MVQYRIENVTTWAKVAIILVQNIRIPRQYPAFHDRPWPIYTGAINPLFKNLHAQVAQQLGQTGRKPTAVRAARGVGNHAASRFTRPPPRLHLGHKLGPRVGQDEVLDVALDIVKHPEGKSRGYLAAVLGEGCHVGVRDLAVQRHGRLDVERGGGVCRCLAAQDAGGLLEYVLEVFELARGQVEREFGVAGADEVGVDGEGLVVDVELLLAGRHQGPRRLPLRHARQKGHVFAGEVV